MSPTLTRFFASQKSVTFIKVIIITFSCHNLTVFRACPKKSQSKIRVTSSKLMIILLETKSTIIWIVETSNHLPRTNAQ